jgi:phenylalanyl-tRNA synthetase beta chain
MKSQLRRQLAAAGANEILTYSFVHGDLLQKVGQDAAQAFQLSNALSPDLQYYRLSLTPSLLDKVHMNIKAGFDEFALFELNKTHNKRATDDEKLPKEVNGLALVYAAKRKTIGAAYFQARRYLDLLLKDLGVTRVVRLMPLDKADLYNNDVLIQQAKPFDPKRAAALVDDQGLVWGFVGEYRAAVKKALKLPLSTAGFEVDPLLFLLKARPGSHYRPLSKFPGTHQDISFKLATGTTYVAVEQVIEAVLDKAAGQHGYVYNLEPVDMYQKAGASKHLTFRITLTHHDRTLVTEEVNRLLDDIATVAKTRLKATRL